MTTAAPSIASENPPSPVASPAFSGEVARQIESTCADCQLLVRRVADLTERVERMEKKITNATFYGIVVGTALSQLAERMIAHF
jgi:hypothetical protein